jgi:hypothetical protein
VKIVCLFCCVYGEEYAAGLMVRLFFLVVFLWHRELLGFFDNRSN